MRLIRLKLVPVIVMILMTSQVLQWQPKYQKISLNFCHLKKHFILSYEIINDRQVKVNWQIQPGYYLYMGMFEFKSLDNSNKILKVEMPEGKKKTDEFW